jgi:threonine dehydratase
MCVCKGKNMLDIQQQLLDSQVALAHIAPYLYPTPVLRHTALSRTTQADIWVKQEYLQHTGSFKLRGALHAILRLPAAQRRHGVVAASSGNHGAAVAYACQQAGSRAVIFVPEHAAPVKIAAMRALGAEVRLHGDDSVISEQAARAYAAEIGVPYISPYNDAHIVTGQGTLGIELYRQIPLLDTIVVAVGGGGLIGGVAAVAKALNPRIQIIGAQPINSAVMVESVRAGHIVDIPSDDTLSDGTAGGIEADSVTFAYYRQLVDATILVSEAEIATAMRDYIDTHHHLIEGAAGVALAATSQLASYLRGRVVAVVACGAGIGINRLHDIMPPTPTTEPIQIS